MENFDFYAPTKILFGRGKSASLMGEMKPFGKRVLMVYGGGSIRKNGIYDTVKGLLAENGFEVRELSTDECQTRFNEILALYEAVGWTNYTKRPERLRTGYAGSLASWGAFVGEKLVGIVRVVGDGATIVFVQDLIVAPSHQRRGIGAQLMSAVMNRFSDVCQMELLTDDGSGACVLYERLGFVRGDAMGCVAYVRVASEQSA